MRGVLGTLGATVSVVGALAIFVWWFIGASPIVHDLDRRLTKLDDPDVGRLPRIEREVNEVSSRVNTLGGWGARVTGF